MNKLLFALFIPLFLITCSPVQAGEYAATVDSVYDGDTIKATVEIWPGLFQKVSIRINGIDTPELRTKNACEKALAKKAKTALTVIIGESVTISNVRIGKYAGRVLADVHTAQGVDVGAYMLGSGHAREYHGGKRQPWCAD